MVRCEEDPEHGRRKGKVMEQDPFVREETGATAAFAAGVALKGEKGRRERTLAARECAEVKKGGKSPQRGRSEMDGAIADAAGGGIAGGGCSGDESTRSSGGAGEAMGGG